MKFNYSSRRLLMIFLSRLAPSLIFWYLALLWGEAFWVVTILLWVEAVVETLYWWKRGYLTIVENQIVKHLFLFNIKLDVSQVSHVFTYGNEWTFTPAEVSQMEIKVLKNHVNPAQRTLLDEKLNEIWEIVRNRGKISEIQR